MARKPPRGSQRYGSPEFRPYVNALGQLSLAWNDLQESLAALFWTATMKGPPLPGDRFDNSSLRIWHAVKSDRYQREMLRAAIENLVGDWNRPNFGEDGKWLLKEVGNLENIRNDAIHSPLFANDKSLYGSITTKEKIAPAWWLMNPKAASLTKRGNLLTQFRYCRDASIILSDFAREMDCALINRGKPWPDRPRLPNRGQKSSPPRRPARPK
jgi:hypothetical protein